jgi:hypothetical protein
MFEMMCVEGQPLCRRIDPEQRHDLLDHVAEQHARAVEAHQPRAEVVQRLLAAVRLAGLEVQRHVPPQIVVERPERLHVRVVVKFFQHERRDEDLRRLVRAAVILAVEVAEDLFVDQRQDRAPELSRPVALEAEPLLVGQ